MTEQVSTQTGPPSIFDHDLNRHFSDLLKFESTAEMEASELWREIRVEAERVLSAVVVEDLTAETQRHRESNAVENPQSVIRNPQLISALAWNIERGNVFEGIIDALKNHEGLNNKDLLLLTELDHGMTRSGNRFVAQEIA